LEPFASILFACPYPAYFFQRYFLPLHPVMNPI
jgi:hypothetical protein